MFYPGGAFSLYSALSWAINSHGKTDLPEWPASDNIARGAIGWPLIDADKRALGIAVPFFKDWVQHSERDGYWSDIDGSNRVAHFKAPALLMAGWYDPFLPTQLKDFVELRSTAPKLVATRSRLIIGPWTHAGEVTFPDSAKSIPFRAQSLAESLPWFDEILQTGNGKFGQHSAVKIFVMGKNKWRDEQEWPLARARYTAFYLHSNGLGSGASNAGKLIFSAPLSDEQDDQYVYDPSDPVPTAGGAMIGRAAGIASQNQLESRRDVTLLD
jgi:hypothetical protein